jgi:hypothetical protein
MFAGRFFPKAYFAGTYFPPVEDHVVPPVEPPQGGTWRTRRPPSVDVAWPVDLDDEELLFWIL